MPNNTLMAERRASLEWAVEAAVTCGYTSDADVLRGLLADLPGAHPGQPEPCADVATDNHRDGMRWRTLMKNGEPDVYVERTERRVIQRTQSIAFSSPNLTNSIGVSATSEMWVKRYAIFAWWTRENEHRTFTEAVDAIAAGAIQ
ncbi:hypothetical protein [Burkholderia sp. BE17]|uniref:hypothetical protein n=1 Tax=Burkholderia sp. BE17 TaxID=2656644 RepID=UPI00128C6352|nr:hypothetical protein [Burkholderia sp. BE17]MPV69426.1 hypothetical protein [Burkholderia sp. BE17]